MRQSKLLLSIPGIVHGFGNQLERIPRIIETKYSATRPKWKQVHGTAQCEVSTASQDCGEVDALSCRVPGLPIAVMSADCVPVLLARRDAKVCAAVHSGWRGTQARIVEKTLSAIGPGDWVAAIGPAIGPCCYEVSEEIANAFIAEFKELPPEKVSPRFRHLDLPGIVQLNLEKLGVETDLIRACTRCTTDSQGNFEFLSYRREKSGTCQYSGIALL